MRKSKELRAIAREGLQGKTGQAIGAMLLTGLISSVGITAPAMMVGYAKYNLGLVRRQQTSAGQVTDGFKVFGKALWLYIIIGFFVSLWSMLFVVPGIIKAFAYSMAQFFLAENPNLTAREALNASKNLMKGKKGKLFCLMFSFIGWILLGYVTLGIAFFYVGPYMMASMAVFFTEAVAEPQEAQAPVYQQPVYQEPQQEEVQPPVEPQEPQA